MVVFRSIGVLCVVFALFVSCSGDENTPAIVRSSATAAPIAPPVPAYDLGRAEVVSAAGRSRFRANLVVAPGLMREQMIAVLTDAARRMLREHPDAKAAVVFAYDNANITGPFTKGRAYISSDGLGWAGDGRFDNGPDGKQIHITIRGPGGLNDEEVRVNR